MDSAVIDLSQRFKRLFMTMLFVWLGWGSVPWANATENEPLDNGFYAYAALGASGCRSIGGAACHLC